jgi:hypothetical protein
MTNCYRFVNCDIFFDDRGITTLLRTLEKNTCSEIEKWWNEVRMCRRRRQIAWDSTVPITTIFTTADEFKFMEFKATLNRIKLGIQEKGMLVYDAFRAFNSSNTGLLNCSELYGGLEFLNIPFTPEQLYELVKKIAVANDGLISYVDFKRVFQGHESDMESRSVMGSGESNFEHVPPKPIPELSDLIKAEKIEELPLLTEKILQNFKVKVKQVDSFAEIWTSEGTHSQTQVSVWSPSLSKSILSAMNRTRLCLGYYASIGFKNPLKGKNAGTYMHIEITDYATIRMKRSQTLQSILSNIFPHPLRYKQVYLSIYLSI